MQRLTSVNKDNKRVIPLADADSGASIGDVLRRLHSRLTLILACTAACVCCSLIYLSMTRSIYQGSALIRIDPGRASSLGLSDLATQGNVEVDSEVNTEIAVIKSDGVALRTLRSLPDVTFQRYTGVEKAAIALPERLDVLSPAQQKVLNQAELSIDAKQVVGTSLIDVTVRSTDPQVASTVVNTLTKSYTIQSFSSRDNSVAELRTWLSAQMLTLKDQVDTAQKKLAAFQEAHNILGTEGTNTTITDRLQILNQSLAASQADRIGKESRLRAASNATPSTLATLFPDPNLTALQTAQGELYIRSAELSAKFGPRYPPLAQINKQLASVTSEITRSANTIKQRLRQEYDAAQTNENMLQKQYKDQTAVAYGVNRNQAEYAVLQGEITSSRELYDLLRRKMQQASIDADVNGVNTVLVDGSKVPLSPIAPKRTLILVGSAILGIFAGIAAALIAEASSDALHTAAQVERELGLPVLAMIPRAMRVPDSTSHNLVTLVQTKSRDAEAYRVLRNAILLSTPGARPKTILVASPLPNAGVGKAAANLAVALAQAGHKVLAVDADLRSPSLHHDFNLDNNVGLATYLSGDSQQAPFLTPVQSLPNLHILPAGLAVDFPAERLASDAFHLMLTGWKTSFDYVILKSAPLLIVSDSLPLASWCDAVLLLLHSGSSRLHELTQVTQMLGRTEAHIAGILIDDVSPSIMEEAGYGKSGSVYFAQ